MSYPLRYVATDNRGRNETGSTETLSPDALAYALYRRRFKSARVTRDGIQVAGVGPHPDSGRITWWSEVDS